MPIAQINEYNTSSATETAAVSSFHFLSADVANGDPGTYPILLPTSDDGSYTYSYEKWWKLVFTDLQGYSSVSDVKVYVSTDAPGDDKIFTSARTSGYGPPTFAAPINTVSSVANQTPSSSSPGSANIGIAGSLSGTITNLSVNSKTDYVVFQLRVDYKTYTPANSIVVFEWTETL